MGTVSDFRSIGSEIIATSTPILEPINAAEVLRNRLSRFGENYNLSNSSHLFRFLVALCGESGAGALKKETLVPRLEQRLEATHFSDLDLLYGNVLGLPRLTEEIYHSDPQNQILTDDDWGDVRSKDALYRERGLKWMRAIIEGPTPIGIRLASEAAIGVECDVFEQYQYLANQASDQPFSMTNIGQTNGRNEFVIIPREPNITEEEKRRIVRLVNRLQPVNSIVTVFDGDYLRQEQGIVNVAASSERYLVKRFVTGRPDVDWPDVDLNKGNWIEASIEKEAPTFAFMDRQESVTFTTISDVVGSSVHVGQFNSEQASLFAHLKEVPSDTYFFSDSFSYATAVAPITLTIPWVGTTDLPRNQVVINNFYPLEYFGTLNTSGLIEQPSEQFWASNEELAPATESLVFDLGRIRPTNFIDFEICQKPIDFTIEWSTDGSTWVAIQESEDFPVTMSTVYLPSLENPWHYFSAQFELVQTRYIRITFTRRTDTFPLPNSTPFPWSIEVRGLRIMHVISSQGLFVPDTGVDLLGNAFRTDIDIKEAGFVIDQDLPGEPATYWQSQPNPTPNAVEALYFDLRTGYNAVNMAYLDKWDLAEIGSWTMQEMETSHYEDGVVIDEIFIEPITFGPNMRIYYSLDDTQEWDDKLWIPIPRHYTLKRGYHSLPSPTFAKYVKLEFSNLAAMPYQPIEYPSPPIVEYRRFPTWVQNYFENIHPALPIPNNIFVTDRVQIDPLQFGFVRTEDNLVVEYEQIREINLPDTKLQEVQDYITQVLAGKKSTVSRQQVEDKIRLLTPVMWQQDLLQQLDSTRALSRFTQTVDTSGLLDTGFNAELGLPAYDPPVEQSVSDLSISAIKEKRPIEMFFPRKCRHGYQIARAPFSNKIAYSVAIKNVQFLRRDYTIPFDERIYIETLDDDAHTEINEFSQVDWRYVVP